MAAGFVLLILMLMNSVPPIHPDAGLCGAVNGDCFWISGTGVFSDSSHWSSTSGGGTCSCTPVASNTVTFNSNSGGGIATLNADFASKAVSIASMTVHLASFIWSVDGAWNSATGTVYADTSTVRFISNGDLRTTGAINPDQFYNLKIETGVTMTYFTAIEVFNQLTVNGALVDHDIVADPSLPVMVIGWNTQYPLVLGVSGNVSQVGIFRYLIESNNFPTHYIAAATYHYLDVPADNGAIVRLSGNVITMCHAAPVFNECAALLAGWVQNWNYDFYTDDHAMNVGGLLWLGDVDGRSVRFHAGASHITAGGIQVKEASVVHWGTAVVVSTELFGQGGQPGYSHQGGPIVFVEAANFTIHGDFYFYNATDEPYPCGLLTCHYQTTLLYANTSKWSIDGWVVIRGSNSVMVLASSRWTVGKAIFASFQEGVWYDESTSPLWDAGTSNITLAINRSQNFNPAGSRLQRREFNDLTLKSTTGTWTYTLNPLAGMVGTDPQWSLWVHHLYIVAPAILNRNGRTVRIDGDPTPEQIVTNQASGFFPPLMTITIILSVISGCAAVVGLKLKEELNPVYLIIGAAVVFFFIVLVLPLVFGG